MASTPQRVYFFLQNGMTTKIHVRRRVSINSTKISIQTGADASWETRMDLWMDFEIRREKGFTRVCSEIFVELILTLHTFRAG